MDGTLITRPQQEQPQAAAMAKPRPHAASKPAKWTPERKVKLTDLWLKGWSAAPIAAALNAMPGEPVYGKDISTYGRNVMQLPRRADLPLAASVSISAPSEDGGKIDISSSPLPAVATPTLNRRDRDRLAVRELLAAGMNGRAIAEETGLPLGDVANWTGEWRAEQAATRAARG